MSRILLAVSFLSAIATAARAQENCAPIQFAHGQSSTIIRGISPPDEGVCYTLATAAGQTANLRVTGRDMIISVIDVGDARSSWTFRTKAQTYKLFVGQMMRSVTNEPFTLTVSVR